jgi:hypothetical protein
LSPDLVKVRQEIQSKLDSSAIEMNELQRKLTDIDTERLKLEGEMRMLDRLENPSNASDQVDWSQMGGGPLSS